MKHLQRKPDKRNPKRLTINSRNARSCKTTDCNRIRSTAYIREKEKTCIVGDAWEKSILWEVILLAVIVRGKKVI